MAITNLSAEKIDMNKIDDIEQEVHRALALFERDFPVALQVIVFHLLHHLPRYVKMYGPVYAFWMYPYERFNSWISRRVLEATVVATYKLSEWANFMEVSNQLPQGATSMLQAVCIGGSTDTDEASISLTDEQL
jgi:hypothetical protein